MLSSRSIPPLAALTVKDMETIAIYSESIISTYGFNLLERLTMGHVDVTFDQLQRWSAVLQGSSHEPAFRLVWAQRCRSDHIKFYLLCDDSQWHKLKSFFDPCMQDQAGSWRRYPETADLLFFQGPHYGDRYGIMNYTHQALADRQIPVLAAVCSVATIYLVLPGGRGETAKNELTRVFNIPMQKRTLS
jgi:hypothetical protein